MRKPWLVALLLAIVLAGVVVVLLIVNHPDQSTGTSESTAPTSQAAETTQRRFQPARIAVYKGTEDVVARAEPTDTAQVVATLPPRTKFGSQRVFLINQSVDGWYEVALPVRPNGTKGWVQGGDFDVQSTGYALVIDSVTHMLALYKDGQLLWEERVSVGTGQTPTPRGQFFITDLIKTPDPGGAYGPYAYGISAYSEVLDTFAGGNGQVGIHGTNESGGIGQAVSRGCVRLPNDVITELAAILPLGTPVTIL